MASSQKFVAKLAFVGVIVGAIITGIFGIANIYIEHSLQNPKPVIEPSSTKDTITVVNKDTFSSNENLLDKPQEKYKHSAFLMDDTELFTAYSKKHKKGVFMDNKGNIVLIPETSDGFPSPFYEGLASVSRNDVKDIDGVHDRIAFIDKSGSVVIDLKVPDLNDLFYSFSEGFRPVEFYEDKWGYINKRSYKESGGWANIFQKSLIRS